VPDHDAPDLLVVVREVALRYPGEELLAGVRYLDVVLQTSSSILRSGRNGVASFGSAT